MSAFWVNAHLAKWLNSVLNLKVLVPAFNQEKAFSVNLREDRRLKL